MCRLRIRRKADVPPQPDHGVALRAARPTDVQTPAADDRFEEMMVDVELVKGSKGNL